MAGKPKKPTQAAEAFKPNKSYPLSVDPNSRDNTAHSTARMASISTVAATRVIAAAEGKAGIGEILDIPALIALMREQATAVQGGSLAEAEAMLINQATALQSLFVRLIEKGMAQGQLLQYETHMRLALRAQSQCRTTLEALAEIKNRRAVVFVRQANIAHGPQQVNNQAPRSGVSQHVRAPARTGDSANQSNELLEAKPHERMDSGAAQAAGGTDTPLETVGAIHGAA
ncbi:MAG: hypothetical protein ACYDC8_08710 [Gammaproteobacteria bacterium]